MLGSLVALYYLFFPLTYDAFFAFCVGWVTGKQKVMLTFGSSVRFDEIICDVVLLADS